MFLNLKQCGLEKLLIERICLLMLSGHKDLSVHWGQFFSYNRNLCEAENFTSNINKLRYLCYRTPRCQEKLPQIQLDMHPCKTILHLSVVVI